MNKKGQVTIFIILAIMIVVAAGIYFSFRETINQKVSGFSGADSVKEYVDECIFSVSEDIVSKVGNGGGYAFPRDFSNQEGFSYHYLEGVSYFPSLEEMEKEINLFVTVNMISCLGNFEQFSNLEIKGEKMEVVSEILNDSVEVKVVYPLLIKKGEEVIRYEDFEKAIIPVRLGEMHFVMEILIEDNYYNEEGICISCMVDLAYEHGFVFEHVGYSEEDLFILSDLETAPEGVPSNSGVEGKETEEPYKFIFVNRRSNEA